MKRPRGSVDPAPSQSAGDQEPGFCSHVGRAGEHRSCAGGGEKMPCASVGQKGRCIAPDQISYWQGERDAVRRRRRRTEVRVLFDWAGSSVAGDSADGRARGNVLRRGMWNESHSRQQGSRPAVKGINSR